MSRLNQYSLPPLNPPLLSELEQQRLNGYAGPEVTPQIQMARDIARQAQQPGADQASLSRALFDASRAVPMSEWRAPTQPLPVSRKDQLRTVLESRERQLRALETFASDPKNPVSQDEVGRIRQRIEDESQRSLEQGVLPSPVAFYETLVEQDSPEIVKAKIKDNLLTVPGFKEEWSSFVTFDQDNQPVYPKWMEEPMQRSMARAMGVSDEDEKAQKEQRSAAADFELELLNKSEPKAGDYDDDEVFRADRAAWENKKRAQFIRANPGAARYLPTFAEEQGFVAPPTPGAQAAQELVGQLSSQGMQAQIAETPEDLRDRIQSGAVQPGDVVVVPTAEGSVGYRMQPNGSFQIVSRFSPGKL